MILKSNLMKKEILSIDLEYKIGLEANPLRKRNSRLNPEVFRRSPYDSMNIYRIDYLASFAVLGLDVKITPTGEVKIIEVNGIRSGMEGFKEAGVKYESIQSVEDLRRNFPFQLDNEELWGFIKAEVEGRNSCDEALTSHINGLGEAPIAYIAARLVKAGQHPQRMEGWNAIIEQDMRGYLDFLSPYSKLIFNRDSLFSRELGNVHFGWESRYGHFAETLIGIEKILNDKLQCDRFFDECRGIKPRTHEYTEENFQRLVQTEQPKYVVIKPHDGARGEGLVIVPATALSQDRPTPAYGLVAESFVPSKPILSAKDGQSHDGCMRYVLFVEEDKRGQIKLYHFGGYWRLCPRPVSEDLNLDGMRANLAQGAIAEKVSLEDMRIVREAIERDIPTFYKNLVQRASPEKAFSWLMGEYQKLEQR